MSFYFTLQDDNGDTIIERTQVSLDSFNGEFLRVLANSDDAMTFYNKEADADNVGFGANYETDYTAVIEVEDDGGLVEQWAMPGLIFRNISLAGGNLTWFHVWSSQLDHILNHTQHIKEHR